MRNKKKATYVRNLLLNNLLFLGVLLSAGCTAPDSTSLARGGRYVIHSDNGEEEAREVAAKVDGILDHYERLFGLRDEEVDQLMIFLETKDGAYEHGEYPALYRNSTRSIHFQRMPDTMLLLHEIAHHFIRIRLHDPPVWMNEGLATYLGWSAMDSEYLSVGEIPVVHYKTLQRMSRNGEIESFSAFCDLAPAAFYEPDHSGRNYSQAWGIVFFLFEGVFPRGLCFSEKLDRLAAMPPEELVALEPSFRTFCREFSAVQMMKERLYSGRTLVRLSSAFRLGLLQDEAAMGALLQVAEDRREPPAVRVVALHAAAMIVLGTDRLSLQDRFMRSLFRIRARHESEVDDAVKKLIGAIREGDEMKVAMLFAGLSWDGAFYPAGHLIVDERL
jgi:hypothetical protein